MGKMWYGQRDDELAEADNIDALMKNEHGMKDDFGKPQWHLLPFKSVEEIVKVLTFGARKYSPENWRKVPDADRRYFSALLRHLTAWHGGEDLDKETKLPHLAHAGCCLLFLMELNNDSES